MRAEPTFFWWRAASLAALCVAAVSTGCRSLGPGSVSRDRAEYASSIAESWKRQTLMHIVKLRYLDPPVFVDVGQIVAGYTVETTVSAGASFPEHAVGAGNTATLSGAARYTDRPTITFTPLTGNRFIKSLMTPLAPESVFYTIQSGWPADGVLFAAVASINGLKNQETTISGVSPPDPRFLRVLALMRRMQLSGTVGMRVRVDPGKQQTALLTFRTAEVSPETLEESRQLRQLLRLDPEATEFTLVFGATASNDREVAVLTRSIIHLMQTMATQVDVPRAHVSEGRVVPGWESLATDAGTARLITIHSSKDKPGDPFVAVSYRDHWFWIDDRDLKTKRSFAFMMMLFTLADPGEQEALPLVTIPAQ